MPADTSAGPATGAASVIHDLGYRRYDGPRLGRPQIVRALAWHSFRSAFGLGRGAKAKIVPLVALVALCLPAVVNAFAMSRGNPRVVDYDTYTSALRDLVMTVFVAVQAPELVSRDLRSRVLPLYFARPIKTIDYPLAKYLAFTAACRHLGGGERNFRARHRTGCAARRGREKVLAERHLPWFASAKRTTQWHVLVQFRLHRWTQSQNKPATLDATQHWR